MKILLVNDDGFNALGLVALADALSSKHDIIVVSPHIQNSASSHSITIKAPVRYHLIQSEPYRLYSIEGTPADCTRYGLLGLGETYDLVLSGINHGANIGLDLHYSGTFSAAAEAALLGFHGIALSSGLRTPCYATDYAVALDWIISFIEHKAASLFLQENCTVLNINFPYPLADKPEAVLCHVASQHYDVEYESYEDSFYCGVKLHTASKDPLSDFGVILQGKIAITTHSPNAGRC